jgi:hypothetical protein
MVKTEKAGEQNSPAIPFNLPPATLRALPERQVYFFFLAVFAGVPA